MNKSPTGEMPADASEQALWHAQFIVAAMKENEGVTLDYSPDSVKHLDTLLKMFHANGLTVERVPKTLFEIGCYAGQVVVNACPGSKWMHAGDFSPPLDATEFPDPVIFHRDNNVIWAPMARVVKVLRDPEDNSLHFSCLEEIRFNGAARKS